MDSIDSNSFKSVILEIYIMKKRTFFTCAAASICPPAFLTNIDAQVAQKQTGADDANKSMDLFSELLGGRAVGFSMWNSWVLKPEDKMVIYKFTILDRGRILYGAAIIARNDGGRVLVNLKQLISNDGMRTATTVIETWPTPAWLIDFVHSTEKGVNQLDPLESKISGSGFDGHVFRIIRSEKLENRIFEIREVGLDKPIQDLCNKVRDLCEMMNFR